MDRYCFPKSHLAQGKHRLQRAVADVHVQPSRADDNIGGSLGLLGRPHRSVCTRRLQARRGEARPPRRQAFFIAVVILWGHAAGNPPWSAQVICHQSANARHQRILARRQGQTWAMLRSLLPVPGFSAPEGVSNRLTRCRGLLLTVRALRCRVQLGSGRWLAEVDAIVIAAIVQTARPARPTESNCTTGLYL